MQKIGNILQLAIIQSELFWEDSSANLHYFENIFKTLRKDVSLVILPETFSTGFTMNVRQFADADDHVLTWMQHMAASFKFTLAGSLIVKEKEKYYNRLYVVEPGGKSDFYNKRHLFTMGREDKDFTRGKDRVIIKTGPFRILLQICYDLRFPVFARNRDDYDAILYVANWPSARKLVWDKLLFARAIENQAYVIGANRTGMDGEGQGTCGFSRVIDPKGNEIAALDEQAGILYAELDYASLQSFRTNFPVLRDRDDFQLL